MFRLQSLPSELVKGIYTINRKKGRMPDRALFLHPEAAESFRHDLAKFCIVSDMLRSAASSLEAVRSGRGAQPPGFSGHNYGLSIDIEVDEAMKAIGVDSKEELDRFMELRGWYCHRRDGKRGREDWHYNYLRLLGSDLVIPARFKTTSGYLEALIQRLYGDVLKPDDKTCQTYLRELMFYRGAIDGKIGPQSREAVRAFQRAWGIKETAKLDKKTRRTLAFVANQN
jgi:hypothetical protein